MTPEEPKVRSRFVQPLQALAVSIVLFLLSIGLCSVGRFTFEGPSSMLATVGFFAFLCSIAVFIVAILWLIIAAALSSKDGTPPPSIR